jgi:FMN phosphatase YigB (HAD superfamily)
MSSLGWLRTIRYVLFDWGGTLCRNDRERDAIGKGIESIADQLGIDPAARVSVAASLGKALQEAYMQCDLDPEHRELDAPAIMSQWGDQMGLSRRQNWDLSRMVQALWQHWQGCADLLGEPIPVLEELRRRGYTMALLSNVSAPAEVCRAELQRLGLLGFFRACTFSSELGLRKPHKVVFETAVARLTDGAAVDPSCVVYVGDSPRWDVGGARAVGLRTILFRSPASSWPEEDFDTYEPDAIIDRLPELLLLLPQRRTTTSTDR